MGSDTALHGNPAHDDGDHDDDLSTSGSAQRHRDHESPPDDWNVGPHGEYVGDGTDPDEEPPPTRPPVVSRKAILEGDGGDFC